MTGRNHNENDGSIKIKLIGGVAGGGKAGFFGGDHPADAAAELIHQIFSSAGGNCIENIALPRALHRDNNLELGKFVGGDALDFGDIRLFIITRGNAAFDGGEVRADDGDGLVIRAQITFVAGEQEAALPGFGIFSVRKSRRRSIFSRCRSTKRLRPTVAAPIQ